MMSRLLTWVLGIMLLIAQLFFTCEGSIGCLDNDGKPVDWFIVIKLPRISDSSVSTVQQGVGQLYMDVNNEQWTLLDQGINDTGNHAVYNTLQQIYSKQNSQEIMFMLYNDEVPGGRTSLNHGHTKGDVCFDKSSGFWLVHSVPKFPPPAKQGYSYPTSGTVFGQSLLCVTFSYQQLNNIGQQFLYNYPKIYDSALPTSFVSANPNIADAINGKRVEAEPWSNVISLPSEAGQTFISFAKYTSYGADLYDALVAPYFKAGLNVETWLNGVGPLPSNCSARYKVMNVNQLKLLDNSYEVHEDHSKWAVSVDNKWICIGDINREEHQKKRAGGTLCSQLRGVSRVFNDGIVSTEKCTSEGSKLYFRSWRFNQ